MLMKFFYVFNIGIFSCEFIVLIYTISRGVFMIRGFQFTDFRLYHFYVFSYIMYGIHKNDVFLYVVHKWFNLVQVTDGWSEGGVLVGKTHTS